MADNSPLVDFKTHMPSLTSPATKGYAITEHDTTVLSPTPRALWVGGAGDLTLTGLDDVDFVLVGVAAGSLIPVMVKKVKVATTATNIVGLL